MATVSPITEIIGTLGDDELFGSETNANIIYGDGEVTFPAGIQEISTGDDTITGGVGDDLLVGDVSLVGTADGSARATLVFGDDVLNGGADARSTLAACRCEARWPTACHAG